MSDRELWQLMLKDLSINPKDFKTVPRIKRPFLYFNAKVIDEYIIINNALISRPSCNIRAPRRIRFADFQKVYSYYDKWKSGIVVVRDEVRQQSRNTAYIFGLISYYRNK